MDKRPLFRADVKQLIREVLSSGAWTRRRAMVRRIVERAGDRASEKFITTSVKKSLQEMIRHGEIEGGLQGGVLGQYRLRGLVPDAESVADLESVPDAERVETGIATAADETNLLAGVVRETEDGSVFVAPVSQAVLKPMIRELLASGAWVKRNLLVRQLLKRLRPDVDYSKVKWSDPAFNSIAWRLKKAIGQMKADGEIEGGREQDTFAHYRLTRRGRDGVQVVEPSLPATESQLADGVRADSPRVIARVEPVSVEQRQSSGANDAQASAPSGAGVVGASALRVVGEGRMSVYVYFYEADRTHWTKDGRTCWPCKIGMATRDAAGRLREQGVATARARPAVWALEMRTDDARRLEKLLHRVMAYAGREEERQRGSGTEWFSTTPAMVESIFFQLEAIRLWPD